MTSDSGKFRRLSRRTILLLSCIVFPLVLTGVGWLWVFRGYLAYQPVDGDLVFQSLPHCPLVDAIESATESPYSHCGIVVRTDDDWMVLEAISPVKETPLFEWISRGRECWFEVYRLKLTREQIADVIAAGREHLGKPYDGRYRMDDESIYCSELLWKAYKTVTNKELAPLVRLGDLNWQGSETVIREQEDGDPPLDRLMITPAAIVRSDNVKAAGDDRGNGFVRR